MARLITNHFPHARAHTPPPSSSRPNPSPPPAAGCSTPSLSRRWGRPLNPSLQPYVATGYRYRGAKEDGAARYEFKVEKAGDYEVRVSYSPHENRATNTRVLIESADGVKEVTINQRTKPPLPQNFISLGVFKFGPGKPGVVTIGGKPADGNVHADAVQLLPK